MTSKFLKTISLCFVSLFILASVVYGHQQAVVIPLGSSSPTVADYIGGNQRVELTASDQIIRSLTLEVPKTGLVVVNATGFFDWSLAADRTSAGRCTITQDTSFSTSYLILAGGDIGENMSAVYLSFAGTRTFPVNPGTHTFNLVCNAWSAADNDIAVADSNMNAIFYYVPNITVPSALPVDTSSMANCDNVNAAGCN